MWGKNLMEALGVDPSFLSGSTQYATANIGLKSRLGSLPSLEDFIRENLQVSMRLQSGNKRIRKKRAKASLRIQWKLLLAFSRIASRRINYSEIGRRLLAVQPLPQGAEPIYYKDPDFYLEGRGNKVFSRSDLYFLNEVGPSSPPPPRAFKVEALPEEAGDLESLSNENMIRIYRGKALVCLCDKPCGDPGSSWCPPQKKARRALEILTSRGVEMPQGLHLALSEDESCGRRSNSSGTCEFDELMKSFTANHKNN